MKIKIDNHLVNGHYYGLTCLIDDKSYAQECFFIQTIEYYINEIYNKET